MPRKYCVSVSVWVILVGSPMRARTVPYPRHTDHVLVLGFTMPLSSV